tara:strand:+ start:1063 stop:1167 length:105 start_codon:yes stop_codon:yes gene_type:complete
MELLNLQRNKSHALIFSNPFTLRYISSTIAVNEK